MKVESNLLKISKIEIQESLFKLKMSNVKNIDENDQIEDIFLPYSIFNQSSAGGKQ